MGGGVTCQSEFVVICTILPQWDYKQSALFDSLFVTKYIHMRCLSCFLFFFLLPETFFIFHLILQSDEPNVVLKVCHVSCIKLNLHLLSRNLGFQTPTRLPLRQKQNLPKLNRDGDTVILTQLRLRLARAREYNGAVEVAPGLHLSMLPNNHLCWDSLRVKAQASRAWPALSPHLWYLHTRHTQSLPTRNPSTALHHFDFSRNFNEDLIHNQSKNIFKHSLNHSKCLFIFWNVSSKFNMSLKLVTHQLDLILSLWSITLTPLHLGNFLKEKLHIYCWPFTMSDTRAFS